MARISESGTARSPLHTPPKSSSTLTTPPPPPKRPRLSLTLHPSVPSQMIKSKLRAPLLGRENL
ncbi:hypothetical protein CPB84DRAFT_1848073 [Gymnopilus junonius]|uniref:Uncharacterized protein n=1 Tax=Gymnopilus junonius TaxID=109634 RepID=A0A9P5NKZ4_GYMJU|nr:hypothetical protein CPB84DRAFT_1848073 [Gymnopilus junonius]